MISFVRRHLQRIPARDAEWRLTVAMNANTAMLFGIKWIAKQPRWRESVLDVTRKTGLKPCGSCRRVWYCDRNCQKKSWPTHKADCHLVNSKTEELSRRLKCFYDTVIPGMGAVYYWGNIPAVDLINLPLNEGVLYNKPLKILACGVGDPRNVLLSLSQKLQTSSRNYRPLMITRV